MTTLTDIKRWYDNGDTGEFSHMIVKVDMMDHEDYPVYVSKGDNPREVSARNVERTIECYSYALGWDVQSKQFRAQNWDF